MSKKFPQIIFSFYIVATFLLAVCSAAENHTETHGDIDLKFYNLVEDVLKEKYHNDEETKKKTLDILKNSGIIESIYEPELLNDKEKLIEKLEKFISGDGKDTKVTSETSTPIETSETSTAAPKIHKIIIKNETVKKGFDICSLFSLQFFIGIAFGIVLGLPVGAGVILYVKRGKTYNYAISKPKPSA